MPSQGGYNNIGKLLLELMGREITCQSLNVIELVFIALNMQKLKAGNIIQWMLLKKNTI